MTTLGAITRRTFLVGSAVIAGGVAFGVYTVRKPIPNPLKTRGIEGEAAITPYVLITEGGITLITPRADVGQGAYSVQAHLLAEELDIDPQSVALSPGLPDQAYYNSEVAELLPFASTDDSGLANAMRSLSSSVSKLIGMQMTGGSSTVPDAFEKLRTAGAVARETLKAAAAQRTGLDRGQLKTDNGSVVLPSGERIAYTALAAEAGTIDPIEDVTLRNESQWRYIGKAVERTDILGKSTGTQSYGIDLVMDHMLYATVRTNPGYGAKAISYDASKAQGMRGVKQVVAVTGGIGILADNTWRAFQAANAVVLEWAEPDYPATTEEMFNVLASSFTEDLIDSRLKNEGDVESALEKGEAIEAEYRIPALAHAPLEPINATVLCTDERIDIWTGSQIPGFIQQHAADITGIDKGAIFVHVLPMGGSFGRRLDDAYILQALELGMAAKGIPVKMTWTREEDFSHDFPRPPQLSRAKGSVKNGKVDTFDLSIASDSVATSWMKERLGVPLAGPDMFIVQGAWDQPFAIPNYRVTGYRAPVKLPISSWRSVGASGNGFMHCGFLDELIHAAGADPLAELMRLCNHDVSRNVLATVGEMCGWQGTNLGPKQGRGIAFTLSFGVPTAEVVDVTHTDKGIRIDNVYVALDVGTIVDPINFEAQVMGGVIFSLAHAMNCELTYQNHMPTQTNFHLYEGMRINQTPKIFVKGLEQADKIRGVGEPAVPPAPPALANAIFAATGQRIRELPLNKHIDFV